MSLFDNKNVEEFKAIPAVRDKFRNYTLLNSTAFKHFLNEDPDKDIDLEACTKSKTPATKKWLRALGRNPERVAGDMVNLKIQMCRTVNGNYVRGSIARALDTDLPGYDAIVIIKPSLRSTLQTPTEETEAEMIRRVRKDKIAKIVGFLIAQKGECPKYPTAYSVNLICAREKGISSMLMGCYMYCIKRHPEYMQKGLLELADEYDNLNGFCAYRKMGYVFDPDIYSTNCLTFDSGLLPMSVDIHAMSIQDIVARTTQSTSIPDVVCKRAYSANLEDEENYQESMFRYSIKTLYRLYYLISMVFLRKDNFALIFLFQPRKPYMRKLKSLLKSDYQPASGSIVAYAVLKILFLNIIDWIQGGGSFTGVIPSHITGALTKLYGLFPPGILSGNPLLNYIEKEIHSTFDSYIAYQASVRDGTYVSPPSTPTGSPSAAVYRPHTPPVPPFAAKFGKKKSQSKTAKKLASAASKQKSEGGPGKSSVKSGKTMSQSKTAKKLASASSKKKLQGFVEDTPEKVIDKASAKVEGDLSDEEIGMYYTLGYNMLGELKELPNIAKINKVMGELGISAKMKLPQFIQATTEQCGRPLNKGEEMVLQRFVTIYILNNRTNQILATYSIGPNTKNGLDLRDWVIVTRICPKTPTDKGEATVIKSICESFNAEFAL